MREEENVDVDWMVRLQVAPLPQIAPKDVGLYANIRERTFTARDSVAHGLRPSRRGGAYLALKALGS